MIGLALTAVALLAAGPAQPEPRDPFRPPPAPPEAERPPGLAGWRVSEVRVRGVLVPSGGDGGFAVLESPPGHGFMARPGDELLDGIVAGVDRDGVFFVLRADPEHEFHVPLAQAEPSGEAR